VTEDVGKSAIATLCTVAIIRYFKGLKAARESAKLREEPLSKLTKTT
jgi:hypothetical protein